MATLTTLQPTAVVTAAKPFSELPVSTITAMAYVNCTFNIANINQRLATHDVSYTTSRKFNLNEAIHGHIYKFKKGTFRNQYGACIFVVDKFVTFKIFATGKFHLTGCKNLAHQRYAVLELMNNIRRAHSQEYPTYKLTGGDEATVDADGDDAPITIILEEVMTNIDFKLDFVINQCNLDCAFQKNPNFYTVYDSHLPSVLVYSDYDEPAIKRYNQVTIYGPPENPRHDFSVVNSCPKARVKNKRTHTWLVFSSSKVIQSGRYYDSEMEPAYNKFMEFVNNHRSEIELHLTTGTFDMSSIKGIVVPMNAKEWTKRSTVISPAKTILQRIYKSGKFMWQQQQQSAGDTAAAAVLSNNVS